jgi:hypothetical protein
MQNGAGLRRSLQLGTLRRAVGCGCGGGGCLGLVSTVTALTTSLATTTTMSLVTMMMTTMSLATTMTTLSSVTVWRLAPGGSGAYNAERPALLRRNRPAVDLRVRGFHYVGLKACRAQR